MSEMVERVARAIAQAWNPDFNASALPPSPVQFAMARAAIRAMREPTEGMIDRGQACLDYTPIDRCEEQAKKVWRGMIEAALR